MSLNEAKIKQQVKRAITLKPTRVQLKRTEQTSNGMRGGTPKEANVAELDIFIDDSKHNLVSESTNEAGAIKKTRGITMIAIAEGFEIKENDYFTANGVKYKVTYPGYLIDGVYNSDLEVVK